MLTKILSLSCISAATSFLHLCTTAVQVGAETSASKVEPWLFKVENVEISIWRLVLKRFSPRLFCCNRSEVDLGGQFPVSKFVCYFQPRAKIKLGWIYYAVFESWSNSVKKQNDVAAKKGAKFLILNINLSNLFQTWVIFKWHYIWRSFFQL